LQTSFFRSGLYSSTEFDVEANLLDYNIWAFNYPDYSMISDSNEFGISDNNKSLKKNEKEIKKIK